MFAGVAEAAVLHQGRAPEDGLNGVGRDGDLVAVDEEDAADVEDLVVAEVGRLEAEELPHHAEHRRLVLVQPNQVQSTLNFIFARYRMRLREVSRSSFVFG